MYTQGIDYAHHEAWAVQGNQRGKCKHKRGTSCFSQYAPNSTFYWAIALDVCVNWEIYQKAYTLQIFGTKQTYMCTGYKNERKKKKGKKRSTQGFQPKSYLYRHECGTM